MIIIELFSNSSHSEKVHTRQSELLSTLVVSIQVI